MSDTQAQEAARLADAFERSANWLLKGELIAGERAYPLAGASDFQSAAALLRQQAARIAELESRVHTCGPTCSKAGCINRRLTAERDALRAELARMREPLSDGVDESGAPRPGYLIRRINVGNLKAIYRNGSATPMLAALGNCINAIEDAQTVLGITKTGGGV